MLLIVNNFVLNMENSWKWEFLKFGMGKKEMEIQRWWTVFADILY